MQILGFLIGNITVQIVGNPFDLFFKNIFWCKKNWKNYPINQKIVNSLYSILLLRKQLYCFCRFF